ncbi:DUF418 domain-containing protein [Pontimicrobium sp. MEBiC01747]
MNQRLIGIDVARALAIIGMIIVNFKMVFGSKGSVGLQSIVSVLDGKAAATFVVLAGIGIAFITNKALETNNTSLLKKRNLKIIKRAILLFIVGLSYLFIWPADILHFYGIYMLFTLLFIKKEPLFILKAALVIILLYPVFLICFNYETNWNFKTFEYANFWSIAGFIRNLFYNGFHPVMPWVAFMLIGLWFGRQDLNNTVFIKKSIIISLGVFLTFKILSMVFIALLSNGAPSTTLELSQVFGTSPMPPLPFYMITASSFALFIISLSLLISKKLQHNILIISLAKTGQLALSFYVAHVVIGMGLIDILHLKPLGEYSLVFSVVYGLIFSALCIIFAVLWLKHKTVGPLEWVMKKLTN